MFMVSEFLKICAVIQLCQSLDQDVNLGQTGFSFTIVNVFLFRKRGEGGGQKVMAQDIKIPPY